MPDPAPTPLGPGSLTWRYFGDTRMLLVGPRAAVLQNMLPALGQGVLDHSVFFSETFARLKRSAGPILDTVYGGDRSSETGRRVRDYHVGIKGTMPDGSRYHALDPETYYWAHATFLDNMLYGIETFVRPLGEDEKRRIYDESKTWFRMYGVSDRAMPDDWEAFQAYWKRMLDEEIVAHKTARYGVGYATKGLPAPPKVPKPVWRAEFVLGKFFGVAALLAVFCALLTGLLVAVLRAREGQLAAAFPETMAVGGVSYRTVALAGLLQWAKLCVLGAFTLLIASFAQTQLFTAGAGFFVLLIGHVQYLAQDAYARSASAAGRVIGGALVSVFPNFQLFAIAESIAAADAPTAADMMRVLGYGFGYAALACALAVFSFRHREI